MKNINKKCNHKNVSKNQLYKIAIFINFFICRVKFWVLKIKQVSESIIIIILQLK